VIYLTYLSDFAKSLCSVWLLKIVLAIIRNKQKTYPSSVLEDVRLTLKLNFIGCRGRLASLYIQLKGELVIRSWLHCIARSAVDLIYTTSDMCSLMNRATE
jgi:hypothetical protein